MSFRIIPRVLLASFSVLLLCSVAAAAEPDKHQIEPAVITLSGASDTLRPAIGFLPNEPVIDGRLDRGLNGLPRRSFGFLYKENRDNPATRATYRIAYGTSFLYLFIDVEANRVITRDRGYQNGDGFILILNTPQPGNRPAGEYYQLAYNPTGNPRKPFAQMVWARDDDWPFSDLSDRSRFSVKQEKGHAGYELLLRWDDVIPYHPWVSGAIGFNLFFVKAISETDKNWLAVTLGPPTDADSFAAYSRLEFAPPALSSGIQSAAVPGRNNMQAGDTMKMKIAVASPSAAREEVRVTWLSGEGSVAGREKVAVDAPPGVSVHEVTLDSRDLPTGGYTLRWESIANTGAGSAGVTMLPANDAAATERDLKAVEGRISAGSLNTLRFEAEEIQKQYGRLKSYETCPSLRGKMEQLNGQLRAAVSGRDVIAEGSGIVRRAFRSKVDGTLQPYTIFVPGKLEAGTKYPAIVFLHGSDSDDQSISTVLSSYPALFPDQVFVISPYGRGKSNGFTKDHAQEDIREAVSDAVREYAIEPSKIVLSGFSMGGYGVYRTLYEDAGRYAAAAVFSGIPVLNSEYGGESAQPDFRQPEFLKPLQGKNILVLHGSRDRNCPVELTVDLVSKMKAAGIPAVLLLDKNAGHEPPNDPGIQAEYLRWLKAAIGRE